MKKYLIPTYTLGLLNLRLIGVMSVIENLKAPIVLDKKLENYVNSKIVLYNFFHNTKAENL